LDILAVNAFQYISISQAHAPKDRVGLDIRDGETRWLTVFARMWRDLYLRHQFGDILHGFIDHISSQTDTLFANSAWLRPDSLAASSWGPT
jgi:hypothetical protein